MLFKTGEWTRGKLICRIEERLPGGHMAELYVAKLRNTEHLVVVKAVEAEGVPRELLMREAEILGRLRQEGIPELYGCFEDAGKSYYIMSYYKGMNLEQYVLENGCMSERMVQKVTVDICRSLAYLHSKRIQVIHNDLKPANLILQEDGHVVLIDFGLAERLSEVRTNISFQGTLGYAAPECWHREKGKLCPATDIFALGATVFYLLEGRNPREHFGKFELSAENRQKKNRWQSVLNKCCALDVCKRFQSAAEVYEAVSKIRI